MSNPAPVGQPTASELFASAKSAKCVGTEECHWCGAPCQRVWMHDDDPPIIGQKSKFYSRRPGNPWVCVGCWVWRYRSTTVHFLDSKTKPDYLDRQKTQDHSWWIVPEGAWAIREESSEKLKELLLEPPEAFCLAFIDPPAVNHLQLMVANHNALILGDTPLWFTVNGTKMSYCIYELENVISTGELNGKGAGVRYLVERLKWKVGVGEKKGPGRPVPDAKLDPKRAVRGKAKGIEIKAWDEGEEGEDIESIFPPKPAS